MYQFIQLAIEDGIATLTLDRADKRNALKRESIEEALNALETIENDSSVRVLFLKSTGSVFCAGMDLSEMQERATSPNKHEEWNRDSVVYCDLLSRIHQLPFPTVAVLQGPALAGGMGLVVACDIVLAAETAFFSLPEPMRGITAAMVTPFLIHRVGNGPATYMLLSGKRVSAEDAFRFGLIHEITSADQLDEASDVLAKSILTGSPNALAITKNHLAHCTTANLLELVKDSIAVSAQARETEDAREGLAAFLEKRKPNWMKSE